MTISDSLQAIGALWHISPAVLEAVSKAEMRAKRAQSLIDEVAKVNQARVLAAFQKEKVALRHFAPTSGYGYDDTGRDTLDALFADVLGTEDALVRPQIASGTHALGLALFGLLRPGDKMFSIAGAPYDTLEDVIGMKSNRDGSLSSWGVGYLQSALNDEAEFDLEYIRLCLEKEESIRLIFIQRSRGYAWRPSLSVQKIDEVIRYIRQIRDDVCIVVDNCYGEFTQTREPQADVLVGSLIKNPGGGLAPTGGYNAGKKACVEKIAERFTTPGIGKEVGSYYASYQPFYQGLFMAPTVVAASLKTAELFGHLYSNLGFDVLPKPGESRYDIIQSIRFGAPDPLIAFCQGIQTASPVDSYVVPEPWDMPGYQHQVIMAAGAFTQGASIVMSADGPIRPPYTAYFQGGLTYEHGLLGALVSLQKMVDQKIVKL